MLTNLIRLLQKNIRFALWTDPGNRFQRAGKGTAAIELCDGEGLSRA